MSSAEPNPIHEEPGAPAARSAPSPSAAGMFAHSRGWCRILPLSPRECEIARLVGRDLTNKEIAAILDISVWTVATHLRRIFAKLSVRSKAGMIAVISERIPRPLPDRAPPSPREPRG